MNKAVSAHIEGRRDHARRLIEDANRPPLAALMREWANSLLVGRRGAYVQYRKSTEFQRSFQNPVVNGLECRAWRTNVSSSNGIAFAAVLWDSRNPLRNSQDANGALLGRSALVKGQQRGMPCGIPRNVGTIRPHNTLCSGRRHVSRQYGDSMRSLKLWTLLLRARGSGIVRS